MNFVVFKQKKKKSNKNTKMFMYKHFVEEKTENENEWLSVAKRRLYYMRKISFATENFKTKH